MQVFHPEIDVYESARCLDPSRLGNQYYREGMTLLTGGWSNHPASKMYQDYKYYLTSYLLACQAELQRRGKWYGKTAVKLRHIRKSLKDTGYPPFIRNKKFHASHRSKLIFKGKIFALTTAISEFTGLSYKKLKEHLKLPNRNQLTYENKEFLENYCIIRNIKYNNYYEQFGWFESDNLEYLWPV